MDDMARSKSTVPLHGPDIMVAELYGKMCGKKVYFPSMCHSPWDAISMVPRPTS